MQTQIQTIIEEIDFLRACSQAGGKHQHAFDLCVSATAIGEAARILEAEAERVRRGLERQERRA